MIQFNELRITEDNKCLIIDVQIEDSRYFEGVTIGEITVDTQDTYLNEEDITGSVKVYPQMAENEDIIQVFDGGRRVRAELVSPLVKFCKNLFFVHVRANLETATSEEIMRSAPCACSEDTAVAAVANMYPIYQNLMSGIRELADTCTVPQNFINSFLQFQAVNTALEGGNYPLAIKYWNKFYKGATSPATKVISKGCGCHGRG